jgi:hypothetical protein
MSLQITKNPSQFQPVLSDDLYFTLSGDTTGKFKYRFIYELYVNDLYVFGGKCTPNPYGLGIVDLQQVLENYCDNNVVSYWNTTPIYTHQTFPFSRPSENETITYYVKCGYEYSNDPLETVTGFTGIGNTVGDPEFQSNSFKTFKSTMGVNGRATQQSFDIDPFVLSGTPTGTNPTTSGLFLTNSPRIREVQSNEWYTLGFTNYYLNPSSTGNTLSEPYYVKYNFYNDQGVLISATTYENITTNGGGPRTTCNQVYPQLFLIDPYQDSDWNTLYVGAGPENIPNFPSNCVQYTVQLFGKFTGTTTPIQPSPTPTPSPTRGSITPTPTPTPSSTPICPTCTTYQLQYTGSCESLGSVSFTNCNFGTIQTIKLSCGVIYEICSCSAPFSDPDINIITGGSCIPSPTPTPTPTRTKTPTPTPSQSVFNYLGRTTPDQPDGALACSNYSTVRGYQSNKSLSSLTTGDYLYDTYPSSPTNGGGQYIALTVGGVGTRYYFQVQSDGEITDNGTC